MRAMFIILTGTYIKMLLNISALLASEASEIMSAMNKLWSLRASKDDFTILKKFKSKLNAW